MKSKSTLVALAAAVFGFYALPLIAAEKAKEPAKDARTVVIVANDNLKFSVKEIVAKPGEKLHVQLRNEGTLPKASMGHDWVLLKAGSNTMAYAMAAIPARESGYLPPSLASEVLASIPLLGPKEVGDVTFTCPTKPGKYPYVCSCNGHAMAGMSGTLVVK